MLSVVNIFIAAIPYFWSDYNTGIGNQYWKYQGPSTSTGP